MNLLPQHESNHPPINAWNHIFQSSSHIVFLCHCLETQQDRWRTSIRRITNSPGPPPTKMIGFPLSNSLYLSWSLFVVGWASTWRVGAGARSSTLAGSDRWSSFGSSRRPVGMASSFGGRLVSIWDVGAPLTGANVLFMPPFRPTKASHFNGWFRSLNWQGRTTINDETIFTHFSQRFDDEINVVFGLVNHQTGDQGLEGEDIQWIDRWEFRFDFYLEQLRNFAFTNVIFGQFRVGIGMHLVHHRNRIDMSKWEKWRRKQIWNWKRTDNNDMSTDILGLLLIRFGYFFSRSK